MKQKQLGNIIFGLLCISLLSISAINFSLIVTQATGIVDGGTQIGGRITAISPLGCQLPPPAGTGPDAICTANKCTPNPSNNGVTITPSGYSGTSLCPSMTMMTSFAVSPGIDSLMPITPGSVGWQIAGLFTSTFPGPAIMNPASGGIGTSN